MLARELWNCLWKQIGGRSNARGQHSKTLLVNVLSSNPFKFFWFCSLSLSLYVFVLFFLLLCFVIVYHIGDHTAEILKSKEVCVDMLQHFFVY